MTNFKIKPDAPVIYSENFTIRSYHVDLNRKLTIQKLCSFFQEIAGNHTEACGVGWELMQEENVFWVLSRLKIDVTSYPEWRDKITIRTWSNGLEGLMAVRNFQVLSHTGEELIKAISTWLMVNTASRRIVKANEYMRNFPLEKKRLFKSTPKKVMQLKDPLKFQTHEVSYTETDMNNHMNNVSYIDRIINTYDTNFLVDHRINNFEINFLKEALPGESIFVQQQKISANEYLNNIVQADTNTEMVRTHLKWAKR